MKRRQFILLSGGAGAGSLTMGSGAFSSVTADRSVSVNVVDDDEAYLGLKQVGEKATVDGSKKVLRVTNLFPNPLDLTVRVVENPAELDGVHSGDILAKKEEVNLDEFSESIGSGEQSFIELTPEHSGTLVVGLEFSGEADGGSVTKTRSYEVDVYEIESVEVSDESEGEDDPETITVEWQGNSKVRVYASSVVDVDVKFSDGSNDTKTVTGNELTIDRKGGNSICYLKIAGEHINNPSRGANCNVDDD